MRHVVERQQEAQRAREDAEAQTRAADAAAARAHERSRAESLRLISALVRAMNEAGNPGAVKIKLNGDRSLFPRAWRAWYLGTHKVWFGHGEGGNYSAGTPARTEELDIALTTEGTWLSRSAYDRRRRKHPASPAGGLLDGTTRNDFKAEPLDVIALAKSFERLASGHGVRLKDE